MISTKGSMVLAGDPGPIKTRKQLTTSCLSLDLRRLAQKSRLIPMPRLRETCLPKPVPNTRVVLWTPAPVY